MKMYRFALTAIIGAAVILSGCEEPKTEQGIGSITPNESNSATPNISEASASIQATKSDDDTQSIVYATVGNHQITKAQVDERIKLTLFDLEWTAYELRLKALATEIDKFGTDRLNQSNTTVLIEPPMPPRLTLTKSLEQPHIGSSVAPIQLAIFCSYPSSHCASMMRTYEKVIEANKGVVQLTFYDFPQPYHFNSGNAAAAARCANEGGQFWRYHKGLLSRFNELKSDDVFIRMAQQVGIDKQAFSRCLKENRYVEQINQNIAYANELGLTKVPVTLINGLYLNGPRSAETLQYYIDKELERLGSMPSEENTVLQEANRSSLPETQLPLRLEGVSIGNKPEQTNATIYFSEKHESSLFKENDEILPNVFLVMVQEGSVIIENKGQLEKLVLSSDQSIVIETISEPYETSNSPDSISVTEKASEAPDPTRERYLVEPEEIPSDLEYSYRGVKEPRGETPLSREWLQDQLVYRQEIQEHFGPAELDVEGYQLMRLNDISESEFYQTLGLQDKDVIMRVNEQWVHSGQNSLLDKLEQEDEVSIVLMRNGLPVHILYAIN